MSDELFHLRDGLYFGRDGEDIILRYPADLDGYSEVRIPVNEWASAVAATSAQGHNGTTFTEALQYLGAASG